MLRYYLLFIILSSNTKAFNYNQTYCQPEHCKCTLLDDVFCNNLNMSILPRNVNPDVRTLDLSNNLFTSVPQEISNFNMLRNLIMSNNQIFFLNMNGLQSSSLIKLDLSRNKIRRLNNLNIKLNSLKELDLSHNPIKHLFNDSLFISRSMQTLVLKNCSIIRVPENFLTTLPNLQTLIISENINLNHIYELKSDSVEILDISYCNIETVNLSHFSMLKMVDLSGNRITRLPANFLNNIHLRILDISDNGIKYINRDAFIKLNSLEILNLSTNVINNLHPNTFIYNKNLITLNISRTYLTEILPLNSSSIKHLDLSINEIQNFNANSLEFMTSLAYLRVSRNLIRSLPSKIKSTSLTKLDMSTCQIIDIKEDTFLQLTSLDTLILANNKLTEIKLNHFPNSLKHISLQSNPWRCDCTSNDFRNLYYYLKDVVDSDALICQTPAYVSGKTWFHACENVWRKRITFGSSDHFGLYVLLSLLGLAITFCTILSIRRIYKAKNKRIQQDRIRQRLEAEQRIRRLRVQEQANQQAQQNAPDPRELERPPSYVEAIRMPRIDSSYTSLSGSRPNLMYSAQSNPDISIKKNNKKEKAKSKNMKNHVSCSSDINVQSSSVNNNDTVVIDTPNMVERHVTETEINSEDEASVSMIT